MSGSQRARGRLDSSHTQARGHWGGAAGGARAARVRARPGAVLRRPRPGARRPRRARRRGRSSGGSARRASSTSTRPRARRAWSPASTARSAAPRTARRRRSPCATCATTSPRSASTRPTSTRCRTPPRDHRRAASGRCAGARRSTAIAAADSELRVNVTADGRVLSVLGAPASTLPRTRRRTLTAGEAVRAVQDDVGVHRSLVRKRGVRARRPTTTGPTRSSRSTPSGSPGASPTARPRTPSTTRWSTPRPARSCGARTSSSRPTRPRVGQPPGRGLRRRRRGSSTLPNLTSSRPRSRARTSTRAWTSTTTTRRRRARRSSPGAYPFTPFGTGCDRAVLVERRRRHSWQTNSNQNAVQAFYLANRFHDHLTQPPIRSTGSRAPTRSSSTPTTAPARPQRRTSTTRTCSRRATASRRSCRCTCGNAVPAASQQRRRRVDPLPRVHARADAPARHRRRRRRRAELRPGGRDGRGLERLLRQGLPGQAVPGAGHGDARRGQHGRLHGPPGTTSIRKQGLDCPVGARRACPGTRRRRRGGFTYGDFGKIVNGPEVHADGEIWAETLWDLRAAVGVAGRRAADHRRHALTPPEPSFLDMRNAILQADAAAAGTLPRRRSGRSSPAAGWASTRARSTAATRSRSRTSRCRPNPSGPRGTIAGARDRLA